MNLPQFENVSRTLPTIDYRSSVDQLKNAAQTAMQPGTINNAAHADAEVIIAKLSGKTDFELMDGSAGANVETETKVDADAYANVNASHDIVNGDASVNAKAGAMVGTKTTNQVGADVMGAGLDVTGEAWAGTGATAEAGVTMDNWKIDVDIKAGVGVELGGELGSTFGRLIGLDTPVTGGAFGVRTSFDAKPIVDEATESIDEAIDNAKDNVDAAKEFVEDVKEKAEDAIEDTGEAVSDFLDYWL